MSFTIQAESRLGETYLDTTDDLFAAIASTAVMARAGLTGLRTFAVTDDTGFDVTTVLFDVMGNPVVTPLSEREDIEAIYEAQLALHKAEIKSFQRQNGSDPERDAASKFAAAFNSDDFEKGLADLLASTEQDGEEDNPSVSEEDGD